MTVLISLLVCLIPTTIGGLLSAIGIAGMDRLVQRNVLAMSGRAVEAVGRRRRAAARQDRHDHARQSPGGEFMPVDGVERARAGRGRAARVAGRRDAGGPLDRGAGQGALRHSRAASRREARPTSCPFTAQTRMSGVDIERREHPQRRGRRDRGLREEQGGRVAGRAREQVERIARAGRHAAGRRAGQLRARRDPPQGHRQGRHARALRRAADDGHPHRHDHRRQPADRRRRSPTRPASTTSWPRRRPRTSWR